MAFKHKILTGGLIGLLSASNIGGCAHPQEKPHQRIRLHRANYGIEHVLIDNEDISFDTTLEGFQLDVRKPEGKHIEYVLNYDLEVKSVQIKQKGEVLYYGVPESKLHQEVFANAQIQVDAYLKKLGAYKKQKAIDAIK